MGNVWDDILSIGSDALGFVPGLQFAPLLGNALAGGLSGGVDGALLGGVGSLAGGALGNIAGGAASDAVGTLAGDASSTAAGETGGILGDSFNTAGMLGSGAGQIAGQVAGSQAGIGGHGRLRSGVRAHTGRAF